MESLKHTPYLKQEMLEKHLDDFLYIEKQIESGLSAYPNFVGVYFSDVSAGGIQISGFHKDVKSYFYGSQVTINYDFSNMEEAIKSFVFYWKALDTEEHLKSFKDFINDGNKYGWD